MTSRTEAIVRELSRINKENSIIIIINKCVPGTVRDELRKFVRGDISDIDGISESSKITTGLDLDTNIDNIRLESEVKVLKKQLDCAEDIIDNLKGSISDKEFIISLSSEDYQTGKSRAILCEVATPSKNSQNEVISKQTYSEIVNTDLKEKKQKITYPRS
ncbi:hypothetical protein HHI36_013326 [Cryptolaemus montrouzieri]|uniref:Uncharacterized protein n=1 Tax=Cryptolaemus montrouzieri TaxID=559131 RepID=A0ABD2NHK3_9CUCU